MALSENPTIPTHGVGQKAGAGMDFIRDRFIWTLVQGVLNGAVIIAKWGAIPFSNASPQELSVSDYWIATHNSDGREIRLDITYTGDDITGLVIAYNTGVSSPGMTTIDGGTITIARDGNGNITGITSA